MADFTVIELLLLQLFLIFLNAVFACAEIAVISVNENKLKKLSEEGNRKAKRLLSLTVQPAKFLATIHVGTVGTVAALFAALLTVFCLIFSFMTVITEGILSLVNFKNDVSALAAVAAIRTAVRYIFFPAEAYMAVAALTGTDIYGSSVCEH